MSNGPITQGKNTVFLPANTTVYNVNPGDDTIYVNTSTNSVVIYMPSILGSGLDYRGKKFSVIDYSGNAATNNIVIYGATDSINGGVSVSVTDNNGSAELCMISHNEYSAELSSGGGGGETTTTVTKDVTSATTFSLAGLAGRVIVNLTSSNATETINSITGASEITELIVRPGNGLTVTFNDLAIGTPDANLRLYAQSQPCIGTLSGYITFETRSGSSNIFEVDYIDQYYTP